jgi:hypothetical protein
MRGVEWRGVRSPSRAREFARVINTVIMSLELLNTIGTFGTFVVIATTALAALRQLRHMRGSNQIAALSDLYEKRQTPEFVAAAQFVFTELPEKLQDAAFRYQITHRAARTEESAQAIAKILTVASFYEEMGLYVKARLVDSNLVCDMHAGNIVASWDALSDAFTVWRYEFLGWAENFEYLTVVAQDWMAKHPSGSYPPNVRRLVAPSKWRNEDEQYAERSRNSSPAQDDISRMPRGVPPDKSHHSGGAQLY